jgi:hypothetical protein
MRVSLFATSMGALLALSGCVIESNLTPRVATSSSGQQHADDYDDQGYDDQGYDDQGYDQGGAGHATGGSSSQPGYSPNCPTPDNHCLQPQDVFVNSGGHSGAWSYVEVATQQSEPSPSGEATYFLRRQGQELVTSNVWVTRPARADDLAIGKLVIMVHRAANNVYRPPNDRDEAYSRRWWIARVASLDGLSQGQILVTGGYHVNLHALRVVEGDDSPIASVGPDLDQHFVSRDHWLVSTNAPRGQWSYVELAAPIRTPSAETQGQGHFITTRNGTALWTPNAWHTRPATAADLREGMRVFMVHRAANNVYRAPNSHAEALNRRWWTATVTDTSELFRDVVKVSGGYTVSVDAIRIPIGGAQASLDDAVHTASAQALD